MSFGIAIGDFIAVGTLAWNVYRSCKGMRGEFEEVAREARTAHIIVQELVDEAKDQKSVLNQRGAARKSELLSLITGLRWALADFDKIILKYKGLSRRERRIWDQLRLAAEDLSGIRAKLTYHLTAINAFTASLERGTLARIETVLLELVEEVRDGRRPPTLVSIDHAQDASGWKELQAELAEDGITEADVAEHKAAIRVFLLGRLKDSCTDDLSFCDVASAIESANDDGRLVETLTNLSQTSDTMNLLDHGIERQDTIGSQRSFHTAQEHPDPSHDSSLAAKALQVSFAPFTRIPEQHPSETGNISGSAKRFGQLTFSKSPLTIISRYRRSVDYGRDPNLLGPDPQMILIIDPIHSAFSKIMHTYLRSLIKTQPLIRRKIDTVHSTGWQMQRSGGIDMISIDEMVKELLLKKGVEVPSADIYYKIAEFHLGDVLQFDHIIYLNSPTFLQFLEDNVHRLAQIKAFDGLEDKQLASLTKYDLPTSIQLPELMSEKRGLGPEIFQSRQKLALEEIFKAVQRFTNDFLEKEFGIRKSSQGFKRVDDRRPSSASIPSIFAPTQQINDD